MARKYAEISHFRAPFKNWPAIAGYGADAPLDPSSAMIDTEKDGTHVFKPPVADAIKKMLTVLSVVFLDDNNVKLDVRTPGDIRQSADAWVKEKVAAGNGIVAGSTAGALMFATPTAVDRFLSAVSSHEGERQATQGISPLGAVLVRVKPSMFASLGPVGVAAVALLAVGGLYMVMKKKRHYTANMRGTKLTPRRRGEGPPMKVTWPQGWRVVRAKSGRYFWHFKGGKAGGYFDGYAGPFATREEAVAAAKAAKAIHWSRRKSSQDDEEWPLFIN